MLGGKLNLLCMTIFSEDGDPMKRHQVMLKDAWKTTDIHEAPSAAMVESGMKHLRHWANENYPDYKDWKVRLESFVSKL
jgi:hypothetical protein